MSTPTAVRTAHSAIQGAISYLNRHYETADLSGELPLYTYQQFADLLRECAADCERIAGHSHKWNDDDYCDICGADGRA